MVTLEFLIWTNANTRATALVRQDGILCKTGALTRRYLGTFRTVSTTTTSNNTTLRYLYNYYNRLERIGTYSSGDISYTYNSTTERKVGGLDNGNRVLIGVANEHAITNLMGGLFTTITGGSNAQYTVGYRNTTTAADSLCPWNGVIDTGAKIQQQQTASIAVAVVGVLEPSVYERTFSCTIDTQFQVMNYTILM